MIAPSFCAECSFPIEAPPNAPLVQVCAVCAAKSPDGKSKAKLRRAIEGADYSKLEGKSNAEQRTR